MNRIKDLRLENNWKQSDLAERLHVNRQSVGNYETEVRGLDVETIEKLCHIFDCTADYLLGFSDQRRPEISDAEWRLLAAYRAANVRDRGLVDQILAAYVQATGEEESAI